MRHERGCVNWHAFMNTSHIVVGVVLALACLSDLRTRRIPNVLTFAFPESGDYDRGQVFGFLLLWCGAFGAAIGGVTALVVDRMLARRAGAGVAEHESTHLVEDEPS